MSQKFFKVVRIAEGMLLSCAIRLPENVRVEYLENQWVRPQLEGSKLFCFSNLICAEAFAHDEMYGETVSIYECEVKNPEITKALSSIDEVVKFWERKRKNDNMKGLYLRGVPGGSYSVDAIKLVNKIKTIYSPYSW